MRGSVTKQLVHSVITIPRKILKGAPNKVSKNGAERYINCPANIVAGGRQVNEAV